MSLTAARDKIADMLKNGYSGNPQIFAEGVQTPESGQADEWVRWSIRLATAYDADVGGIHERIYGTLWFQHFHAEGLGTREAYLFADKVGAIFNAKSVGHLSPDPGIVAFERAVCQFAGQDGGWIQHSVQIPFRSDAPALNAA